MSQSIESDTRNHDAFCLFFAADIFDIKNIPGHLNLYFYATITNNNSNN